jgi:predicted secreted protein
MPASSAVSGYRSILARVTTPVPEVRSLTGPGASRDSIEVTHLSSDSAWKEFIAGMKDGGTVQATINWLSSDATHVQLAADFAAGTKVAWTIDPSGVSADVISFSAFVLNFDLSFTTSDAATLTLTLKITGAVTYA